MLTRRSLIAAAAGAALGLALSAAQPGAAGPLRIDAGAARTMLGAMLGSLITVAAVLFWIRGTFVQLAAAQFSARVVQGHLSDRHERRALPFLVGAFSYAAVVLLGLPGRGAAPATATLGALLVSVAAFLTVVRTIEVGLRMSQPSTLVLALARHAVTVIRARLPAGDGSDRAADAHGPPGAGAPVCARASGWLTGVDEERLLGALPPGALLELRTAPGRLVSPGQEIARLHGGGDAEAVADALGGALALSERRPADDIDVALRELVDVTLQAMAPGAGDALRGYEAMDALAWVLAELLSRDVPVGRRERDGRVLLRGAEPSHEVRVRAVLEPLAEVVTRWGPPTRALQRALDDAAARLERQGLPARAALLRRTWADVRG
ncbi:MAG TPA: DUF2254 family protein [Egibacteraceae bacterium]|nr:DUF2254 family protein [Egibacteraceae bacterium]